MLYYCERCDRYWIPRFSEAIDEEELCIACGDTPIIVFERRPKRIKQDAEQGEKEDK